MAENHKHQFKEGRTGSAISVRVIPRSPKNEIVEIQSDGIVKVRLTAPPIDGKANEALIIFLSDILKVQRSSIEIISGTTGRTKLISIIGLSPDEVTQKLMGLIAKN